MATNATNPTRDRMPAVIHWLIPSRRQVAISVPADVVLAVLGLPLWVHLILGVVIHLAARQLELGRPCH
jgi:hypothetical protein